MPEYEFKEPYLPKCKGPFKPKPEDKLSFWKYWKIVQKETGMLATNRPTLKGWYLRNYSPQEAIDAWYKFRLKLGFINRHKRDAFRERERRKKKHPNRFRD